MIKFNAAKTAAASLLLMSGVAAAQEPVILASVSPGVMVNQGDMYMPAEPGMELNSGDQVMVLESGEAQIEYADGCKQQVGENQVMQIVDVSTCPKVASNGSTTGLGLAAASTTGSVVTSTTMGATSGGILGMSTSTAIGVAAVGTVAIVGEVAESDNDDGPGLSP